MVIISYCIAVSTEKWVILKWQSLDSFSDFVMLLKYISQSVYVICTTLLSCNIYEQGHISPPASVAHIKKTCLYNFDSLKPHFYIVKLGFTGVYIIFLISAQKHRLWVLVRNRLAEAVLTSNHNLCFELKCEIYQCFLLIWKISVFEGEIFYIFE